MMLATYEKTQERRPMEHRWGDRVEIDVPVSLAIGREQVALGRLRDASISGGFIATLPGLPVFTNLLVRVPLLGEQKWDLIELHACVMRRTTQGIGVEWRDMASPAVMTLLRRATGEPQVAVGVA